MGITRSNISRLSERIDRIADRIAPARRVKVTPLIVVETGECRGRVITDGERAICRYPSDCKLQRQGDAWSLHELAS